MSRLTEVIIDYCCKDKDFGSSENRLDIEGSISAYLNCNITLDLITERNRLLFQDKLNVIKVHIIKKVDVFGTRIETINIVDYIEIDCSKEIPILTLKKMFHDLELMEIGLWTHSKTLLIELAAKIDEKKQTN